MKIRVNDRLTDWQGAPVAENATAAPLTLREVVMAAFLNPQKGDEAKGARERTADYDLFLAFAGARDAEAVEVSPEQLTQVRERVARGWMLAVSGPALKALGG